MRLASQHISTLPTAWRKARGERRIGPDHTQTWRIGAACNGALQGEGQRQDNLHALKADNAGHNRD